jgi:proline iminopeptidase
LLKAEKNGYATVNGFRLFYRVFGTGNRVLLCLHGGPGWMLDYLLPLSELADETTKVVLYDQLGCGKSERPKNAALFTADRFVEEVEGIRRTLDLGNINLMGSSWGGMLALLYALKYQRNIERVITTGGFVSVPECVAEMNRLKTQLSRSVQDTLRKYEEEWAFWHPEYLKAVDVYYHNFLCRMPRWPKELVLTIDHASVPVYVTMWGPNEFTAFGNLKDLDFTARLREIQIPTLITGGRYDEITPRIAETIHNEISESRLKIFENSAHLPMWEEEQKHVEMLREVIVE